MNRLLQGDVGAGKTAVAAYAMLLVAAHGKQSALMAPTEILARQHLNVMTELLAGSRVRVELLTGSLKAAARREVEAAVANGVAQIVVGTHALASESVRFADLALAVVDEQHRFGVRHRAALQSVDGVSPHYLVMTATPIPRSLAMTLFGDLDVTRLMGKPPGRQAVQTYVPRPDEVPKWWEFVRRKLNDGRQAYVVAPYIGDASDETAQRASVEAAFERLANDELEGCRIGLLHGRLDPVEATTVLDAFRAGRLQVLIATSLIEVGLDAPNAAVMTILEPSRFGLAQLHQLRGRVGRGRHAGYCAVLPSDDPEERRRLEAFAACNDGFEIAELDFQLRGPGDLIGRKQSGLPRFRIADLARDGELLALAREDAARLVQEGAWETEAYARLSEIVHARHGAELELGDVG